MRLRRRAIGCGHLVLVHLLGCGAASSQPPRAALTPRPGDEPRSPYVTAHRAFTSRLLRLGPAPREGDRLAAPDSAETITYRSDGRLLTAFVDACPAAGPNHRRPAVLFLHGGYAFGGDHWRMARPFREAGYVVMVPVLRGENGQPGSFTLFHGEVDDAVAAGEALAARPEVDTRRMFVAGHSVGGTLALLTAMASPRFRAVAALSAAPDVREYVRNRPDLVPFDPDDLEEYRVRSPINFVSSLRCPARLFLGDEEYGVQGPTERMATLARQLGQDVAAITIPGDHTSAVPASLHAAIDFFRRHEGNHR